MTVNEPRPCICGSGHQSWWLHDARAIPVSRVCEACIEKKRAQYRPEIFTNPNYYTDEPVEAD